MFRILWKVIGDGVPACLRANKDMLVRLDRWLVYQRAHRHMNISAVADDGIKKRTAGAAMGVMALRVAEDHHAVLASHDPKLCALYPGEGLERRPSRAAA